MIDGVIALLPNIQLYIYDTQVSHALLSFMDLSYNLTNVSKKINDSCTIHIPYKKKLVIQIKIQQKLS
jgi:hypothetical protein